MRTRSGRFHLVQVIAQAGVIALIVVALAAGTTLAAKGGNGGGPHSSGGGGGHHGSTSGGTINLVLLDPTDIAAGVPHYGHQVTFDVSTSATAYPWVTAYCYQGGTLVYQQSNGIFPTSLGEDFTLASGAWQGGDADCTAYLQNWDQYSKHGKITNLASIDFHVYS